MGNQLATVKKEVFDVVSASIGGYVRSGEIALPEKYSFGNAIKSAWLILQETKDKNDKHCPFYRSRKEQAAINKEIMEQLRERKRFDLIEKYHTNNM